MKEHKRIDVAKKVDVYKASLTELKALKTDVSVFKTDLSVMKVGSLIK